MLDEILERLNGMPDKERQELEELALQSTKDMKWIPNPGPQTDATYCDADELFYGGQAGGGKSSLINGLAVENHQRSLILRRIREDAKKLAEAELLGRIFGGDRNGWNGSDLIWRNGKQMIQFGGCEMENDKQRYKGDPHDLICFDEVTDFLESQYEFITIWNRSSEENQRCRVIATGNPPTNANGLWVIRRWAAWLDPQHPNPADPGELRYYVRDEAGEEVEVDGSGPHDIDGRQVYARSRTFIPAKLSDNPDLARDGEYERMLNSLPKELRDAYRDGKFRATLQDEPDQTIPTEWIMSAMSRWTETPPIGVPMCAIGVDVAQGGTDNTVLAPRHDAWFSKLIIVPGKETPGGTDVAGLVTAKRRDGAKVIIDIGGGWGGDAYAHLKANSIDVDSYMGVKTSSAKTLTGNLGFANVRTEAYWRLREALNPDQPGGSRMALPNDQTLLADLSAPYFEIKRSGSGAMIHLESKEKLVKRLGRSPDRGDAVVMAWYRGMKTANIQGGWEQGNRTKRPSVKLGRGANAYSRGRH